MATFARRRRQGGPLADPLGAGNTALITALGGNAAVLAFYDARVGVTLASGKVSAWADVRGAGFGPSLVQATPANQPAYDGANITVDGVSTCLISGATAAMFNLVGVAMTLVVVGSINTASGSVAGIGDGATTDMLLVRGVSSKIFGVGGNNSGVTTTVATGAAIRISLVAKNGTTSLSIEVPNQAKASTVVSAASGGDAYLAVGGRPNTGGTVTAFGAGSIQAVLALAGVYSSGQAAAIEAWAENPLYHSAVAA